jgi:uncharacterized membrane protein
MSLLHTIVSVIALLSGGVIFFFTKGTQRHRMIGFTYVISMTLCLITSFFIYNMFGGFGPFHAMAIVSIVTISIGMYFPLFARSNGQWPIHHYFWMSYSYVGLFMALMSHFMGMMPDGWSGLTKGFVAWGIPYILGSAVIFANKQRMIEQYGTPGTESNAAQSESA